MKSVFEGALLLNETVSTEGMNDARREKCESVLTLSCISVLCIFTAFCVLTLASGEGDKSGVEEWSEMKIVCFKDRIPPGNYLDRIQLNV